MYKIRTKLPSQIFDTVGGGFFSKGNPLVGWKGTFHGGMFSLKKTSIG